MMQHKAVGMIEHTCRLFSGHASVPNKTDKRFKAIEKTAGKKRLIVHFGIDV